MLHTQSMAVLACAVLAVASPSSSQEIGNAGVCSYAERKTGHVYPDLCEAIGDYPHLLRYWSYAEAAGKANVVIGVGLGAISLISTFIGSSNLSDNLDNCITYSAITAEGCDEKPVMPFLALGGGAMLADIIFLFTPNRKLGQARLATRDHYRDLYRNKHHKPIRNSPGKSPEESAPTAPSRLPDREPPQLEQIEPSDSVEGESPAQASPGKGP